MVVTDSEMKTESRLWQPLKALQPMAVTEDEMRMLWRKSQPVNESLPISVVACGMIYSASLLLQGYESKVQVAVWNSAPSITRKCDWAGETEIDFNYKQCKKGFEPTIFVTESGIEMELTEAQEKALSSMVVMPWGISYDVLISSHRYEIKALSDFLNNTPSITAKEGLSGETKMRLWQPIKGFAPIKATESGRIIEEREWQNENA